MLRARQSCRRELPDDGIDRLSLRLESPGLSHESRVSRRVDGAWLAIARDESEANLLNASGFARETLQARVPKARIFGVWRAGSHPKLNAWLKTHDAAKEFQMRNRLMNLVILLLTTPAFSSVIFAQTASYDPHDLSGIWERTEGDRGFNTEVPQMTAWGEEKFNSYQPSYGGFLGTELRPGRHIGRNRAVPPAIGNDPTGECNPSGVPRLLFFPRPIEFLQTADRVVQVLQWTRALRQIWTDGRELLEVPPLPRWYGYSVGRWEGNTFVVESNGHDDRTWLDHFGYPHSEEMRLVERYRRVDADTLELSITVHDSMTYTEPWVSETKTFTRMERSEPEINIGGWYGLTEEICAPLDEVDQFNRRIRDPAVIPAEPGAN